MQFAYVAAFGILGVSFRFGFDRLVSGLNTNFPFGTFFINVFGCLIAGIVFGLIERGSGPSQLQAGLLVGFCGGFTTMSAYAVQTVELLQKNKIPLAALYFIATPVFCFSAVLTGLFLCRKLF